MGLVLKSPENFSARSWISWNFLSYDVEDGHSDAGADAKIHV